MLDAVSARRIGRLILGLWIAAALLVSLEPGSHIAEAQSPESVPVLEVRGVIDPIVAQYVQRGIEAAGDSGAPFLIIRLDTPGGLDSAMRQIVQAILNADVPIVVYVSPSGARAASAGMYITMAAHVAAMAPGTNIGAATPVSGDGTELSEAMQNKIINDAVAYIQSIAQERGRNAEWAEEAVRTGASLAAQQAQEQKVVDFLAADMDDLLAQLNGRTVVVQGREVTLRSETVTFRLYPMTPLERIAHMLIDPNIAYLLLSIGTLALFAELYNPGAIIPGLTGILCLILAFVSLGSLPVNWGGVILIVLAFALFALDTQVAGFVLSVAGVISFVLGSLFLFSPFTLPPDMPAPALRVNPWLLGSMTALMTAFFVFAVTASLRAQKGRALTGTGALIGQVGVAVSDLTPQGIVQVRSETWTAVAEEEETLTAGEQVEVVGKEGLRLRVRRAGPRQE